MDSPSNPPSIGQRTLAAIVFTDVVDFSTRVGQDEEATLAMVRRDLAWMSDLCKSMDGHVLKSTGDGLLLYFNSAVQAVQCAMEIQKRLAGQLREGSNEPLQHRIGVHLGDVFVNVGDVLGDGVNIASRLQAQASPGGICLSQTVYDVVRNKLNFQAHCLGPKQLKHIAEPVTIYHIGDGAPAEPIATPTSVHSPRRGASRTLWIAATILGALLLGVIAVGLKDKTRHNAGKPGRQNNPAQTQSTPNQTVNNDRLEPGRGMIGIIEARARFMPDYDFSGMVDWLKNHGITEESTMGGPALKHFTHMAAMLDWFEATMQKYTETNPLVVDYQQAGQPQSSSCWSQDKGRIMMKYSTGNTTSKPVTELKPGMFGLMIKAAIQDQNAKGTPPSTEVMEGARNYSQEYRLRSKGDSAQPSP